jgi:ribosomal protein S18 acetylase RimI-like enzyme
MVQIREFKESDTRVLIPLIRELQAGEVALFDRMKPIADMGQWYVGRLKEKCIEDEGVILIAVVAKEARRRGIGRLLLEDCERRARAAGRDDMRITLLARNEEAHDLYRAFGFDDLLIDMRKVLK